MESLWGHAYDNRTFDVNAFLIKWNRAKDNLLIFNNLHPRQFGEIQQVFLDEIKSNPCDWKIEQENGLWIVAQIGTEILKNFPQK